MTVAGVGLGGSSLEERRQDRRRQGRKGAAVGKGLMERQSLAAPICPQSERRPDPRRGSILRTPDL